PGAPKRGQTPLVLLVASRVVCPMPFEFRPHCPGLLGVLGASLRRGGRFAADLLQHRDQAVPLAAADPLRLSAPGLDFLDLLVESVPLADGRFESRAELAQPSLVVLDEFLTPSLPLGLQPLALGLPSRLGRGTRPLLRGESL